MTKSRLSVFQLVLICLMATFLVGMWVIQFDGSPITSDATQSLQMGINLERHGVMSANEVPPFPPTNFREPLVPLVCALGVWIVDSLEGPSSPEAYFSGSRLRLLKFQNVFWMALLSVSALLAARYLTSSWVVGVASLILLNIHFRPKNPPGTIDDLMNELPSAGLLVAASGALVLALQRKKPALFGLVGLLYGLLVLTKVIASYIFVVLVLVVVGFFIVERASLSWRAMTSAFAWLILPFICLVGPWMIRNEIELGTFQISQRAGYVVYERALEDQMSHQEYLGAIYFYAPPMLQKSLGEWLGYSKSDLLVGGRLQRLQDDPDSEVSQHDIPFEDSGNPDQAVTFYRKARAEQTRLRMQFSAANRPFPDVDQDKAGSAEGLSMIAHHPWQHLAVGALFLWRSSIVTTPLLLGGFIFVLLRRRHDIAIFMLPALGMVAAYALSVPFIPRYDEPMHIFTIILLPIVADEAYHAWRRRQQTRASGQPA